MQIFIVVSLATILILLIQILIGKALNKSNKTKAAIKIDYPAIIGYAIFLGLLLSVGRHFLQEYITNTTLILIITASLMVSYWFFVAPIFYMFKKKNYTRDFELENELKQEGFKYKILISDELSSNAYATGGLPHLKLIILAHDFTTHLNKEEIKAVIYHEIGHHEKLHLIKLFILQALITTFFYILYHYMFKLDLKEIFEVAMVVLISGTSGLIFYYIPNKMLYFFEFEADRFSAKYCGENLKSALIKMDEFSDGDLTKGNINHPKLHKRLNNIAKYSAPRD